MRYVINIFCFVFACSTALVYGQQANPQEKQEFVIVPSEQALVTVASQPDCPLQFEDARLLALTDGGETVTYYVRNRGAKPIRAFTVGTTSSIWEWPGKATGKLLMPGQRLPEETDAVVPLTDALRDKLKLQGPMRSLTVLIVRRVEFADGSVYSGEKTFNALRTFLNEIQRRWDAAESQRGSSP